MSWSSYDPHSKPLACLVVDELVENLSYDDKKVRDSAITVLAHIDPPPVESLITALEAKDDDVKEMAISRLVALDSPPFDPLVHILIGDNSRTLRVDALNGIVKNGSPNIVKVLEQVIQDKDIALRYKILESMGKYPKDFLPMLIEMMEDESNEIIINVSRMITNYCWSGDFYHNYSMPNTEDRVTLVVDLIVERIIKQEQILRKKIRYNPKVTSDHLLSVIGVTPGIQSYVIEVLLNLAIHSKTDTWERATDVGRLIDEAAFSSAVRTKVQQYPSKVEQVISRIGGEEASAYFAKAQYDLAGSTLADYRQPLLNLETTARERWEELTRQSYRSLRISTIMSVSLFIVGTGTVIWGLVMVSTSTQPVTQITSGIISALVGIATVYSGKFWKDPVEHIQRFSAQQARLQVAFIGYMNRIAQLRLQFENDFTEKKLTIDELERYQVLLERTINQASNQLSDGSIIQHETDGGK